MLNLILFCLFLSKQSPDLPWPPCQAKFVKGQGCYCGCGLLLVCWCQSLSLIHSESFRELWRALDGRCTCQEGIEARHSVTTVAEGAGEREDLRISVCFGSFERSGWRVLSCRLFFRPDKLAFSFVCALSTFILNLLSFALELG